MLLNKSCESMKANENYPKKLSIYIECKGAQFEKCSGSFYCKSTIINNYLPPPHHPKAKVDPCFFGVNQSRLHCVFLPPSPSGKYHNRCIDKYNL